MMTKPTAEYTAFDQAYDHFNATLFAGKLPLCLITLQRKANARGYFSNDRFVARDSDARTDEIALNPDTFQGRTDKDILSVLAHEMAHLWQHHFGVLPRAGYHDRQWAEKMVQIGLQPVSMDNPGKMTGQKVTHEIVPGGRFDQAADAFLALGHKLNWQSVALPRNGKPVTKSKVKYTCEECSQNAWAKPGANLVCGDCWATMLAEP